MSVKRTSTTMQHDYSPVRSTNRELAAVDTELNDVEKPIAVSTDPVGHLQRLHAPQRHVAIQRIQQLHGNQHVQRQQQAGQPISPRKPLQIWKPPTTYILGETGQAKTIAEIAKEYYGRGDATFVNLILKANRGIDPKRLRPEKKQKINLPGRFVANTFTMDEIKAEKINTDFTKGNEGSADPKAANTYLKLHVPSDASGVTIGPGYDLKGRTAKAALADLIAAGIDQAIAELISAGAGKTGQAAKDFVSDKNNRNIVITEQQAEALYSREYPKQFNETLRLIIESYEPKLETKGSQLSKKIIEILVDLKFRGDLTPRSWQIVRTAVVNNDVGAMKEAMCLRKNWPNVPYLRYAQRCQYLGGTPEKNTK